MRFLVLLFHAVVCEETALKLFDQNARKLEYGRRGIFSQRHGSWPDPRWLEHEQPSFSAAMARKEAYAMEIKDPVKRWSALNDLAQARLVRGLTRRQWDILPVPDGLKVYEDLLADFKGRRSNFTNYLNGGSSEDQDFVHTFLPLPLKPCARERTKGELCAAMQSNTSLRQLLLSKAKVRELLDAFRPLHESWLNTPLRPMSAQGIRLYSRGATIPDYLEPVDSHVITGILQIDADLESPFSAEILDSTGKYTVANLKHSREILIYESAKCFLARRKPLLGNFSALLYLHYRPVDWSIKQKDITYAVPPFWARGLAFADVSPDSESGKETNQDSLLTTADNQQNICQSDNGNIQIEDHDPFYVRPGEEHALLDQHTSPDLSEPAIVSFVLSSANGANLNPAQAWADHSRCAIIISWISVTSIDVPFGRLTPSNPIIRVNTHLGHIWRATREIDASELYRWNISASESKLQVHLPSSDNVCYEAPVINTALAADNNQEEDQKEIKDSPLSANSE